MPSSVPVWVVASGGALAVALAIACGAYFWLSAHPRVEIINRLAAPVVVTRDGSVVLDTVPAHGSVSRRVVRGDSLRLAWTTIGSAADGTPLVNRFSAKAVFPFARKALNSTNVVIVPHDADARYFAPAITNDTGEPLAIEVNETTSCACEVPNGARRMHVGYYQLYRHSSVRATTPDGRTAVFRDVDQAVAEGSGQVALRFRAVDMRPRQ